MIGTIIDGISTVDAARGSERMITTVCPGKDGKPGKPLGVVNAKQRINVALTRAKGLGIVVLHKIMCQPEP